MCSVNIKEDPVKEHRKKHKKNSFDLCFGVTDDHATHL